MKNKKTKEENLIKVDANGNPVPEKFQNPKKLGFMRFIMILYGFVPFIVLFACFFVSKEQFSLTLNTFSTIIDGLVYAVVF